MQILIPISSSSAFFPKQDFFFPKPLVEVCGKPMIEAVVTNLREHFTKARFIFVIDEKDSLAFSLDKTLSIIAPGSSCVYRKGKTSGALCSCLLAIDSINKEEEIIVANCDQVITENILIALNYFRSENSEAGVITFKSVHPRWSYVLKDDANCITQVYEKTVVSNMAIAGFYYFKTGQLFVEAAEEVIFHDASHNGEYFLSAAINSVILRRGKVLDYAIDHNSYHSFYTPVKIKDFEEVNHSQFRQKAEEPESLVVNLVLPAAGEGSRFSTRNWKKAKPFIDMNGEPMISRVLFNIKPKRSNTILILRRLHITQNKLELERLANLSVQIKAIDNLTEGTACTLLMVRDLINSDAPLLIANSDQIIDFDVDDFILDCQSRDLDGSIVVFKDNIKDPKWSFASIDANELVTEVAEKQPISDLATAGVYFFKRGSSFVDSALDMILANERVNNEFYTCPVYNYMIKKGARIGVYEVDRHCMHGIGTPNDLESYMTAHNMTSIDSPSIN